MTDFEPKKANNNEQHRQSEYTPRYAILVNDMLNDFIHGKLKSERAKDIIPKIRLLLNIAKQRKMPVFYCNDEHLQLDPELRLWGEHAMKGTKGAKVIKELEPSIGDYIIPKRAYGSFDGTNLDRLLKSTYNGKEKIDFIHNHESSTVVLHQAPINSYFYLT
jgi:nicotinamidase-related amidase